MTCLIVGCQQTLTIIRHSYDGFVTFAEVRMGISRDHWHKRRATGGRRVPIRKKRKFELARPAAMTKLAPQRIHTLRVRGGEFYQIFSDRLGKNIFSRQQEVPRPASGPGELLLGVRGHLPQDQDHRRGVQRRQQRVGQNQDPRQERHCRH